MHRNVWEHEERAKSSSWAAGFPVLDFLYDEVSYKSIDL